MSVLQVLDVFVEATKSFSAAAHGASDKEVDAAHDVLVTDSSEGGEPLAVVPE